MLFLNNDTAILEKHWLVEMASLVLDPGVGCVGAKLLYDDETIQHAGIVLGIEGLAGHAYAGEPRNTEGDFGERQMRRIVSAVTGACLAVRRELYEALGGMDERLAVAYNDVDLCLQAAEAGFDNVFTPFAELFHYESKTRGRVDNLWKFTRLMRERVYMRRKWGRRIRSDRYIRS